MSDEDPVDPKPEIEEACKGTPACTKLAVELEACAKRIEDNPEGHCTGQYFDFWHCVDHCTADKLFKQLK